MYLMEPRGQFLPNVMNFIFSKNIGKNKVSTLKKFSEDKNLTADTLLKLLLKKLIQKK